MPRGARLDAPGTLHHVIVRGIEKRKIVKDNQDRQHFVSRMGRVATKTETSIYAWALMKNHAHFLVRSGAAGLPAFMRKLLTGYAVTYNLRHRRHGHLFQNRYKSITAVKAGSRARALSKLRAELVPVLIGQFGCLTRRVRANWAYRHRQ